MCSRPRAFLESLGLSLFLEPIQADAGSLDVGETIRIIEDYKSLDVESATMALALARGIRARYPEWRYLIDGDGGDENLKDYPIEENPELTIRSVIHNPMLYQEGWGVGKIKHSLTYSGGLSRSYVRTYATAHHFGFEGFSPYTRPEVIAVAEAIPFIELTQYSVERLYELKGEIVAQRSAGRNRAGDAGLPQAALPAWRGVQRFFAGAAAVSGGGVPRAVSRALPLRSALSSYPEAVAERDAWILARRGPRNVVDAQRPWAFLVEDERSASGEIVPVATVFLTNRECPWRCLMCDLWRNTLTSETPAGAIPAQIDYALERMPPACQIKLYNSGSFFDRKAIPLADHAAIASRVGAFERTIVECHPALIGDDCLRFRNRLRGRLEVAMGLETAHPQILNRLNKRMTLDQFRTAADRLCGNDIDLRVFILVQPPFMPEGEAVEWAARSLEFAFDCGATVATLIPTRAGNGAMEELAASGEFSPPSLATVEAATEYGIGLRRGRVFVDLWDLRTLPKCVACHEQRLDRLQTMNLHQEMWPRVPCERCGGQS